MKKFSGEFWAYWLPYIEHYCANYVNTQLATGQEWNPENFGINHWQSRLPAIRSLVQVGSFYVIDRNGFSQNYKYLEKSLYKFHEEMPDVQWKATQADAPAKVDVRDPVMFACDDFCDACVRIRDWWYSKNYAVYQFQNLIIKRDQMVPGFIGHVESLLIWYQRYPTKEMISLDRLTEVGLFKKLWISHHSSHCTEIHIVELNEHTGMYSYLRYPDGATNTFQNLVDSYRFHTVKEGFDPCQQS